jgi:hypothetical protein
MAEVSWAMAEVSVAMDEALATVEALVEALAEDSMVDNRKRDELDVMVSYDEIYEL